MIIYTLQRHEWIQSGSLVMVEVFDLVFTREENTEEKLN